MTDYNNTFGECWSGNNGPVRWPTYSPDLIPLDFFNRDIQKEYLKLHRSIWKI